MAIEELDGPGVVTGKPHIRPKDAATLLIVKREGKQSKILMGRRSEKHTFMPGKYVFPGGKLDYGDTRIKPVSDFSATTMRKVLKKTRSTLSKNHARGLGMAAIRETFEETGLVVGDKVNAPAVSQNKEWQTFFSTGYAPTLKPLRLLARAITPPGRPRRFDARFFVVDATDMELPLAHPDGPTDELLEINWLTFAQTRALDLPYITKIIVKELEDRLALDDPWTAKRPIPFFYMAHKRFLRDEL